MGRNANIIMNIIKNLQAKDHDKINNFNSLGTIKLYCCTEHVNMVHYNLLNFIFICGMCDP